ncbi:L-lactate permease, partial [Escherichia coli]
ADRNRSHWSTSKTPSYTKSVSWQHHLFIAAIISIFVLGVGIKKGIGVFAETLISLKWPILSIGMVLAFAFVTNYSGMSTTLALVL